MILRKVIDFLFGDKTSVEHRQSSAVQSSPNVKIDQTAHGNYNTVVGEVSGSSAVFGNVDGNVTISQNPPQFREADLRLVDLIVIMTEEFPKIEFKVRNSSDEVIFLKEAVITTLGQWDIEIFVQPSMMPVSWTYDVKVPREGKSSYKISQEIKPHAADRFEFSLSSDTFVIHGMSLHLLEIELVYNEDNKKLITPKVLLNIRPSAMIKAFFRPPQPPSLLQLNKRFAQEVIKAIDDTTICPEGLVDSVISWAEADFLKWESEAIDV